MTGLNIKSKLYYFVCLFILSFIFRLIFILVFQFDGLYGQDAYAYLDYSKVFYSSILSFQVPPNFHWSIGYPLFVSIFSLFTGGDTGTAALLVSLNAGSLCAGVVFLLTSEVLSRGRRVGDPSLQNWEWNVSLYAGLIVCFSGILVKSSIVIMSDALALLFALLNMFYAVKYFNSQKLIHITLSFIFLALAITVRYAYLITLIPFFIYLIYVIYHPPHPLQRGKLLHYILAFLAGTIIFLPQFYYIIKYGISYFAPESGEKVWIVKWSPVNFFMKDFITKDGTMHHTFRNALFYLTPVFHPIYLSVFGFTFLYGIFALIKNKLFHLLSFFIVWSFFLYIYLAGGPFQTFRFTLSFLPTLAVVSAIGLGTIKFKKLFLTAGIAALIVYNIYHLRIFAEQKQNELTAAEWVNKNIPENSALVTFEITGPVSHYSKIRAVEFYNLNQNDLKNMIDSSKNGIYFILPEEKFKTQWKGLPVEENFRFLESNYNLITLGEINYYKGYKVGK